MSIGTTLPTIHPRPEFAGILKERNEYGTGQGADTGDRVNSWFDTLMMQCGWDLAPSLVLMLCLCSAVAVGGSVFVLQENLLTTAFAGIIGYMLPIIAAMFARTRRQSTLMQQLPPMLEELGRAAKTGRSIDQCLQIVAEDTPSPLGDELRLATRRLQMGVSMKEALRDLPTRTGVMTLSLLSTTLTVQQQTGGDLVTVLNRLSRTIRDRLLFLGRLKAATAASRATAILMIVVPPAVLTFFVARDPDYLQNLMASGWGRNATLAAIGLEIIGAIWVLRILKDSERT